MAFILGGNRMFEVNLVYNITGCVPSCYSGLPTLTVTSGRMSSLTPRRSEVHSALTWCIRAEHSAASSDALLNEYMPRTALGLLRPKRARAGDHVGVDVRLGTSGMRADWDHPVQNRQSGAPGAREAEPGASQS